MMKHSKIYEINGVLIEAKQNHKKTKSVNVPHTKLTIAIPLMDNGKFEEMVLNDGHRICIKIEYLPNKHFLIEGESTKWQNR